MARIHEEVIAIKVSTLVREDESVDEIINADIEEGIQAVLQELVGADKIVEIIKE